MGEFGSAPYPISISPLISQSVFSISLALSLPHGPHTSLFLPGEGNVLICLPSLSTSAKPPSHRIQGASVDFDDFVALYAPWTVRSRQTRPFDLSLSLSPGLSITPSLSLGLLLSL